MRIRRYDWNRLCIDGPEFVPLTGDYKDLMSLRCALHTSSKRHHIHVKTTATTKDGVIGLIVERVKRTYYAHD